MSSDRAARPSEKARARGSSATRGGGAGTLASVRGSPALAGAVRIRPTAKREEEEGRMALLRLGCKRRSAQSHRESMAVRSTHLERLWDRCRRRPIINPAALPGQADSHPGAAVVEPQVREARRVALCPQWSPTSPRSEEAARDREGIGTALLAVLGYLHTQQHLHRAGFVTADPTCLSSPASVCRACAHACGIGATRLRARASRLPKTRGTESGLQTRRNWRSRSCRANKSEVGRPCGQWCELSARSRWQTRAAISSGVRRSPARTAAPGCRRPAEPTPAIRASTRCWKLRSARVHSAMIAASPDSLPS